MNSNEEEIELAAAALDTATNAYIASAEAGVAPCTACQVAADERKSAYIAYIDAFYALERAKGLT